MIPNYPDYAGADETNVVLIVLLICIPIFLGLYIWYGFVLSRLFPKLSVEGWKGWVPLLNEMIILERGGAPDWVAALLVVPGANFYALYVKWTAMSRLGERFGKDLSHSQGLAMVGVFLPQIWAMKVAAEVRPTTDHYGERIQGMMAPVAPVVQPLQPVQTAPPPPPPPRPPAAPPAPPPAPPVAPPAPPPAPPVVLAVPEVATAPAPAQALEVVLLPEPVPASGHVGATELTPEPAIDPTPELAARQILEPEFVREFAPAPEPQLEPEVVAPSVIENPWAPSAIVGETTPRVDAEVQHPIAIDDARANVAELPTIVPSQHPGILDAVDDDLERTVVVDRRPVVRWSLVTEAGIALPMRSDSVLLGRKPTSVDGGVELIAVPDDTRTLSKNHARLDLSDGIWTVTDLNSTNGVTLVADDGSETQLPAGGSSVLSENFILGNVTLRLVFENGTS